MKYKLSQYERRLSYMIKEVIVVEGRDDITAVKRAVDAEVIAVGGFGINKKIIDRIIEAQVRQGVIVLTDPDFAGEKIRKIISKRVFGIKHAYISKAEGTKNGDIGVENAEPSSIIKALESAKCQVKEKNSDFNAQDMMFFKLMADSKAKERREILAKELRIGYCNSSQFVSRLNNYGITREEFTRGLEKVNKEIENGKNSD
jgi:ribonuclease M5